MTDFEKALEAAASVFANCRNGKFAAVNSEEWIRSFEGHKEGARWARQFTVDEHKDKINRVLNYCKSNTEAMWAATTVAILLDCDFRDSKQAIEQHFKGRGGE